VLRKASVLRVIALSAALLAGGSGVAAAANDSVRLGVTSDSPAFAIFAAAKSLGFYSQEFLDVDLQPQRGAAEAEDALSAGGVDLVVVSPAVAAAAIAKGVKQQIVATFAPPRASGWEIMVPADSPIKSFMDLRGKSLGVGALGSASDLWAQGLARSAKVPVKSVALGDGVLAALRAKQIDAAIVPPAASYQAYLSGEMRAILSFESALPPTISSGVSAKQEMIDKRADVLRRWVAATTKTVVYMQNHEEWAVGFLQSYLGGVDAATASLAYHDLFMKINPSGEMHPDWKRSSLAGVVPPAQVAALSEVVFSNVFVPGEKQRKPKKGKR
jgi:NitT/TauT family transport system substrate-binding protein